MNTFHHFLDRAKAQHVPIDLDDIFIEGAAHAKEQPFPGPASLAAAGGHFLENMKFNRTKMVADEVTLPKREIVVNEGRNFPSAKSSIERFYGQDVGLNV